MIVAAQVSLQAAVLEVGAWPRDIPCALRAVVECEEGDCELDEVTGTCCGTGQEAVVGGGLIFDLGEHMFVG
jgi:hypothetical protein